VISRVYVNLPEGNYLIYYNWLVVYLPMWKIWVSWDHDIPNWTESHKIHVPNHQPG
jgi:hypothetical protein